MTEEDLEPAYKAPPGACDTHFHVFGPLEQYPVASRSRYEPPHAPLDEYVQLAKKLGIERMVFVQRAPTALITPACSNRWRRPRCRAAASSTSTRTHRTA